MYNYNCTLKYVTCNHFFYCCCPYSCNRYCHCPLPTPSHTLDLFLAVGLIQVLALSPIPSHYLDLAIALIYVFALSVLLLMPLPLSLMLPLSMSLPFPCSFSCHCPCCCSNSCHCPCSTPSLGLVIAVTVTHILAFVPPPFNALVLIVPLFMSLPLHPLISIPLPHSYSCLCASSFT